MKLTLRLALSRWRAALAALLLLAMADGWSLAFPPAAWRLQGFAEAGGGALAASRSRAAFAGHGKGAIAGPAPGERAARQAWAGAGRGRPSLQQGSPAPGEGATERLAASPAQGAGAPAAELPAEPLRFVFPAPGPPPASAWRPALYPTPWVPTPYDHFYFSRPIAADDVNWPLPDYRYGGVYFEGVVHSGVDIPAPRGTPVLAAGPGKVVWAGSGLFSGAYDGENPYGLAVMIRHDFGYQGQSLYTVYGHLDQVEVARGQRVEGGELLGASGQTGEATGPHLHFEIRLEREGVFSTRNPELWLAPPQGWGLLVGRVTNAGGRRLHEQLVTVRRQDSAREWRAYSYGRGPVNSDEYYRENLVISDLPAGRYQVEIIYLGKAYTMEVDVLPGLVSVFTFRGRSGFVAEPLPLPGSDFSPSWPQEIAGQTP